MANPATGQLTRQKGVSNASPYVQNGTIAASRQAGGSALAPPGQSQRVFPQNPGPARQAATMLAGPQPGAAQAAQASMIPKQPQQVPPQKIEPSTAQFAQATQATQNAMAQQQPQAQQVAKQPMTAQTQAAQQLAGPPPPPPPPPSSGPTQAYGPVHGLQAAKQQVDQQQGGSPFVGGKQLLGAMQPQFFGGSVPGTGAGGIQYLGNGAQLPSGNPSWLQESGSSGQGDSPMKKLAPLFAAGGQGQMNGQPVPTNPAALQAIWQMGQAQNNAQQSMDPNEQQQGPTMPASPFNNYTINPDGTIEHVDNPIPAPSLSEKSWGAAFDSMSGVKDPYEGMQSSLGGFNAGDWGNLGLAGAQQGMAGLGQDVGADFAKKMNLADQAVYEKARASNLAGQVAEDGSRLLGGSDAARAASFELGAANDLAQQKADIAGQKAQMDLARYGALVNAGQGYAKTGLQGGNLQDTFALNKTGAEQDWMQQMQDAYQTQLANNAGLSQWAAQTGQPNAAQKLGNQMKGGLAALWKKFYGAEPNTTGQPGWKS